MPQVVKIDIGDVTVEAEFGDTPCARAIGGGNTRA